MIRVAAFMMILAAASAITAADAPPTVDSAVTRGLIFLARQQNRDGSFGADQSRLLATSRALLVFLQAGNVPDLGRYGFAVRGAQGWILESVLPNGGFAGSDGRTRAQAAAVLALAESYGVETSADRRNRILSALRLEVGTVLTAQLPAQGSARADGGGWSDEKNAPASLQITAIAVMALSSAHDVGVAAPAAAFDQARRFILACNATPGGGFGEEPGKPPTVDATAAALLALDVLSPGGDDTERVNATAATYLDSQAASAGSMGFTAGAWLCWCDARLELPAAVKIRDAYVQRLVGAQDKEGAWRVASKSEATTAGRLAVTELSLLGLTARFRSPPILRH